MIYLDSAATSFHKPEAVADAVYNAIRHMGNSGRGGHTASLSAARVIYGTRKKIANLFGVSDPAQVVFTANSTQSLNMTIQGLFHAGDHVITTAMEHNSVLRPLYRKEQQEGVSLSILPCDACGTVRYDLLEEYLQPNTKGIVCTHASNVTGNMVDIARIGAFCKKHNLYFVVDASQTAGVFSIDIEQMGIDVLCFTGHKSLMGPQGTGGLCLRKEITLPCFCVGGSGVQSYRKIHPEEMPTHLEAGTLNGHGIAGLSAALDWITETGMDNIRAQEQKHMRMFYEAVRQIPQVKIYGDFSQSERAPIVTLNIGDNPAEEVCDALAERYDIATRGGAHCAPLMHQHFQTETQGAVRFSFSYFNTEEEIQTAIQAVREIAEEWK